MVESFSPVYAILIPVVAVFVIPFVEEKKTNIVTAIATFLSFIVIATMYPAINNNQILGINFDTNLLISLGFRVDALSLLVGIVSSLLWTLVSVYAIGYMAHEHSLKRYNIFSLLSYIGMIGVAFTSNLFSLYIFFELLSVASYVMVVHEETEEAKSAGLVYLFMGVSGGLILLFSMIATTSITGTSDLSAIGMGLQKSPYMPLIFFGFILGFGVKAGLFPVHIWLPMAHPVAPSPGSALLSGVMIKAGAYGILRTIYSIVGMETLMSQKYIWIIYVLMGLAATNIFLGSAVAIKQTEIKRMLAYSSIAQMGYIILGATLMSPTSVLGGALHIFNHAFIKGTLFLCAGAIIHETGLRNLEDFDGLGKRMPVTMICFTIAGVSMIGFPPFNGFITKWHILIGALQSAKLGIHSFGVGIFAIVLLLLSSFMNLMYYGPLIYSAWFKNPRIKPSTGKPLENKIHTSHAIGGVQEVVHNSRLHRYFSVNKGHDHDTHKDTAHGGSNHDNDINVSEEKGHDDHDDHGHGTPTEETIEQNDPPLTMLIPLIILAAGIVIFGVIPNLPISLAEKFSQTYVIFK